MGRLAAARADLAAVLDPVWPGRVYAYRPTRPNPSAGVYVTYAGDTWGDNVTRTATFNVLLIADGADRAADALLDDLHDQVYDAVTGSDNCYPGECAWAPFTIDDVTELPALSFLVDVVLTAMTWCPPDDPSAVTIPPVPIGA